MEISPRSTLGRFIPGISPVHELDPRCKILCTSLLLIGVFNASSPVAVVAWLIMLAAASRLACLPAMSAISSARSVRMLIIITALLNAAFSPPGETLATIGPINITDTGSMNGFRMGARLWLLVSWSSFLMMTTSPTSFAAGLDSILRPLQYLRIPSGDISMMITIALRFIPTLFDEASRIMRAQCSRGADLDTGSPLKRAKSLIPILIPLFVLVFSRADTLANAMEARCYTPGTPRSTLRPLKWRMRDTAAVLASIAMSSAAIVIEKVVRGS